MKRFTALALMAAALMGGCTRVPEGQKNGTIVKLQQEGKIFKTWEAEMIRGGSFTGGTGVQGAPFAFTISDPVLLAAANKAFDEQSEVQITYHSFWPAPLSTESGYFLDKLDVIPAERGGTQRGAETTTTASVVGVGTETIETILKQNAQALDQNNRLLSVIEKQQK